MKKAIRLYLALFLLIIGTTASWADFKGFAAQVNNQTGTLLTAEEYATQGTAVNFGVAVDANGATTRVDASDASAVATISGKYHSDHGLTSMAVTVPVEGGVKISVGQCTYSGSTITVKDADGNTLVTKAPEQACWKNDHANVTELYYTGGATTLVISGMSYCPYIAVESYTGTVAKYDISYTLGNETAEGKLPSTVTWTEGDQFTIPANRSLYKEGYTLTGWTDGTTTYKAGDSYTPAADVTLQAVFTANAKSLADRTEAATINWSFEPTNGVPALNYQGSKGILVAQATVAGETIDVKMDLDGTNGKINNAGRSSWCQINGGSILTFPSAKGATVTIRTYSDLSTTTIDGQTDYTSASGVTAYTVASPSETIDVVFGNDGGYISYLQVVLPVVAAGGKNYQNQAATVVFPMNNTDTYASATTDPTDGFNAATSFALGDATITALQGMYDMSGTQTSQVGVRIQPTVANAGTVSWLVKPATGLTFTPTKISGYVNRVGTDGKTYHLTLAASTPDTENTVALGSISAKRNNSASPKYEEEVFHFEIALTEEQQQQLATAEALTIDGTILLADNKQLAISDFTVEGILNGTIAEVTTYPLAIAANMQEAGTVSKYPNADDYEAGDNVTLTAVDNFGYDFVNWTDADGNVVSDEAKFTYTVNAAATLTANFKQVNTYELAVAVEGGANDYMVTFTPEPTVVGGKNMYEDGAQVVVAAASNPILTFNNWSTGESQGEITVSMTENKTFSAIYSAVDYIVGWDFVKAGNNGRIADFAAADNDAVSLVLRMEDGTTSGWLDKSQASGGYEGRPAAVNWRTGQAEGDVGHYYWQTSFNASAFTDIKLTTAMAYNYNAYQTQNVEYSLDGENWKKLGDINIPGTKNWTDAEFTFPEECNNQPLVYVRWKSDTSSNIDGSASANDGIALGATYVTGTAKLIDDGKAPALVTTVPAEGATNASANGKIVLTFDEKVKLTQTAKAILDGKELEATVSGKTIIVNYKGLAYAADYTFTLTAGSVADLTDNVLQQAITINFTTKTRPVVAKKAYDFVVGTDGTLAEAIAKANQQGASNTERYRILIPEGRYVLPASTADKTVTVELADGSKVQKTYKNATTNITASNISFIGVDLEKVVITQDITQETFPGKYGNANIAEGLGNSDVIYNKGTQNYFQGLTIKSGIGDALGRNVAFHDQGNKTIFKDASLWGYQDTYYSHNGSSRFYFEGGVLRGRTDYLCGSGDVYYQEVTLQQVGQGGYLAVPSGGLNYGYVFNSCYIKKETSDVTFYLGRPWGSGTPSALYVNTTMEQAPIGDGWAEMSGGYPKRFAEYNSMLTSGTQLDLSGRKKVFGGNHTNNPVLTAEEAEQLTIARVMGGDDDWDPTQLTEQASAPANVKLATDTKQLLWDGSDYVLCWVVFKNGALYTVTTEPTVAVDDADATYSVRAANEAGGLGEATTATVTTAISEIQTVASDDAPAYNVAGQRVAKGYKGIVIKNGVKTVSK